MLESSAFSDFKFVVKGKEFKVHKCILAAASSVFAGTFTADMQEAQKNLCVTDRIDPTIFENILQFIYGGKLPGNFSEIVQELYEAADYYDLKRLMEVCSIEINSQLTKENALDLYCWAHKYDNLKELKKDSWDIVKRDVLKIYIRMENEPWTPEALKKHIEEKDRQDQYWDTLKEEPKGETKNKKRKINDS